MTTNPAVEAAIEQEKLFEGFENLMPFRVQDILLVSSLYDSFILREDGRLNELLIGESLELNLQHVPRHHARLQRAPRRWRWRDRPRFNLIVTNLASRRYGCRRAGALRSKPPDSMCRWWCWLTTIARSRISSRAIRTADIERIFLWQGNARILISIIKYIEDRRNVEHDTEGWACR